MSVDAEHIKTRIEELLYDPPPPPSMEAWPLRKECPPFIQAYLTVSNGGYLEESFVSRQKHSEQTTFMRYDVTSLHGAPYSAKISSDLEPDEFYDPPSIVDMAHIYDPNLSTEFLSVGRFYNSDLVVVGKAGTEFEDMIFGAAPTGSGYELEPLADNFLDFLNLLVNEMVYDSGTM